MIDIPVILFMVGIAVLEVKRGFFRSIVDMFGAILALKAASAWHIPFAQFLTNKLSFSPLWADLIGTIFIFLFVGGVIFALGVITYAMTLLNIGDPFEQILSFIFSLICSGTLVRFILLMISSFPTSEGVQAFIHNSWLGLSEQLITLSYYQWVMEQLEPLMHPGPIY